MIGCHLCNMQGCDDCFDRDYWENKGEVVKWDYLELKKAIQGNDKRYKKECSK